MAFYEHKLVTTPKDTGIRATLRKFTGSPAKLVINITPTLAKKLGLEVGRKYRVFVGTDDDRGTLKFEQHPTGAFAAVVKNAKHTWYAFELGSIGDFPDRTEPAKYCHVDTCETGGDFLVRLPSWAKEGKKTADLPNPLSAGKPKGVTEPVRPQEPAPSFKAAVKPKPTVAHTYDGQVTRAAIEKAKAAVPAPSFGGVQKPTRKQAMDAISKL